jgi:hypothetical protein
MACVEEVPHISSEGVSVAQKRGRFSVANSTQRLSSDKLAQRTPAGFPCGIPGIGVVIEGAMQQAPQPGLHFMVCDDPFQRM